MASERPSKRKKLTHFDDAGSARMVDVGVKPETVRSAIASGRMTMAPATLEAIGEGRIGKGDVLGVARLAGIQAAKRTSDLIPLCHPLRLTKVEVELKIEEEGLAIARSGSAGPRSTAEGRCGVLIVATVSAVDRSGVEMEALTAVMAAALTVYDMCKAIDRGMEIGEVRLDEKRGGKSGTWKRIYGRTH